MDPITQGLYVSAIGLVIIFIVMILFALIMVGIQRLFPAESKQIKVDTAPVLSVSSDAVEDEDENIVVAIAVAISQLRSRNQNKLGERLETGHGRWWDWKAS